MDSALFSLLLADFILVLHVLFAVFVVLGLVGVYAGKVQGWSWVRNPWFRLVHLAAIAVVAIQSWAGIICPLTTLEMHLRKSAGDATYSGAFMSHWLQEILYYQVPAWVFVVCYTAFGFLVLFSWFLVRPHPFARHIKKRPT